MRSRLLSVLKSRLAFVAYLLIAVKPVWSFVSFLGSVDFIVGYLAPVGNFLATGWGTLALIGSGFLLLLYVVYKQQPGIQPTGTDTSEAEPKAAGEFEQLRTELREANQEREELRQENEELIGELENRPSPLPDTLEEWLKTTPLTTVPNKTYRNDRIELDGFFYEHCVFEDCTFSFRGTKPFRISSDSRVRGVVGIDARGAQSQQLLGFLKQLGALVPNSKFYDFGDGRELPYVSSGDPEEKIQRLEAENQRLREYENRYLLTLALKNVREEARLFLGSKPILTVAEEWASRTFELIEKSLGGDKAKYFDEVLRLGYHDPDPYKPTEPDLPNEKEALERAMEVLDRLIGLVTSPNCPALAPDFDGRQWMGSR